MNRDARPWIAYAPALSIGSPDSTYSAISASLSRANSTVVRSTALAAVISLRLVPRTDRPGRVPAAEVLINTAAVREQIRDLNATLNIPDLIKEGTTQYGMQSFDQSLMQWYTKGVISYESALFYASSPSEFALRVQGVAGSSDTSWDGFQTATAP